MSRVDRVSPWGSRSARLVLVGEAPGRTEHDTGEPFSGASGRQLQEWWAPHGLKRSDFYIDNVLSYDPKPVYGGSMVRPAIVRVPRDEMEAAMVALHERLAALEDPWLIVPTGNYALYALLGKGRIAWHQRDGHHLRPGVKAHRGSIYEYIDKRGRRIKCIPTIHPAAILRNPTDARAARADWARIASESQFRDLRLPERTHHIRPTIGEVVDFCAAARNAQMLSVDIETPIRVRTETSVPRSEKMCECDHGVQRHGLHTIYGDGTPPKIGECLVKKCPCVIFVGRSGKPKHKKVFSEPYLDCIGFSTDPSYGICIPLTKDYWLDDDTHMRAWDAVKRLCESPVEKVLQNGLFDAYWLASSGISLRSYRWDTRALHHVLDPLDAHDLAYLTSVYTREPYYKDEAKDPESVARYASRGDAFYTYNSKDACVTLEIAHALIAELERRDLLPYYNRHYADMLEPMLAVSLHGLRINEALRKQKWDTYNAELRELEASIESAAGMKLHAKTGLSTAKLKHYLYEVLRLPKQMAKNARGEKVVSTNEVAVRRLMQRFPHKLSGVGDKILQHRRTKQLSTFVKDGVAAADGKLRSLYSPYTDTGRLNCQEPPRGEGRSVQNIDRELRDLFLPDDEPPDAA